MLTGYTLDITVALHSFDFQVMLGGMTAHLDQILSCRQMLMIASGSSYHSALANQVSCKGMSTVSIA